MNDDTMQNKGKNGNLMKQHLNRRTSPEEYTNSRSMLSLDKQLSLAKYFYTNETQKMIWRNIIIDVLAKTKNENEEEGYLVNVINSNTNEEIQCFIGAESFEKQQENEIVKILKQNGIKVASPREVKIYLLFKKLI